MAPDPHLETTRSESIRFRICSYGRSASGSPASKKITIFSLLFLLCISIPSAHAETFREAVTRARALESSGDDEGAINAYVLAKGLLSVSNHDISVDPRLPLARLYAKCGRYSEAESEYQALLPTGGFQIKAEYGEFLMNQGKFSAASSVWTDLLAQNPNDLSVLYAMGHCLEASDNIDSAKDYYNKIISLDSDSREAAAAESRLKRLGNAIEKRESQTFFPVDPEFGKVGLGWWNLKNMPIHVYIDDGSAVKGYRSDFKNCVYRAMEAWRQASGGKINFVLDPPDPKNEAAWKDVLGKVDPLVRIEADSKLPDDPVKTGIHVHWTESLGGVAIGLAWTNPFGNRVNEKGERNSLITSGHVWLNTNCLADGKALPKISAANTAVLEKQDRMLSEVAIHEFGHALGLMHSSNPKDVMCSGIFAMNSTDLVDARTLSTGDLASLAEHYNNFEGTGFPSDVAVREDDGTGEKGSKTIAVVSTGGTSAGPTTPVSGKASSASKSETVPGVSKDLNAAMFDINSKRYADGIQKLEKVLQANPANSSALYLRAVAQVMMHKYSEAAGDYEKVIKLSPGSDLAKRAEEGLRKIKH